MLPGFGEHHRHLVADDQLVGVGLRLPHREVVHTELVQVAVHCVQVDRTTDDLGVECGQALR
jgi:hypothetical protein